MNGTACYCPVCDEDRTEEETIAVKGDDNGNAAFIGCRICDNRCFWSRPEPMENDNANN